MGLLTKAELKAFFKKKTKLLESEEVLRGLCDYRAELQSSGEGQGIIKRLDEDISELTAKNERVKAEVEEQGKLVKATLKTVKDDTARNALLMHYYDCTAWDAVANILHTTYGAIKGYCYRNLTKNGIK